MGIIKEMNGYRKKYDSSILRGGHTFLRNALSYKLNRQPKLGPLYVGWDITYRCQAQCSFCDRWQHEPVKELTSEQAYHIIEDLANLKTWNISFGGGEPLLRNDLPVLIRLIKKKGMVANVNTNGLLLKECADDLISSGVDTITVSMDSWHPRVHNEIRNCPGLFEKASEGIDYVMAQTPRPKINVRVEVGKHNYDRLKDYIEYWQDKVDEVILQPLHSMGNDFKIPLNMMFNDTEQKHFVKIYKSLQEKYPFLNNAYYNMFTNFLFSPETIKKEFLCYAGTFTLQLDPEGNVYPCTGYCHKVGNVYDQSIKQIWSSDLMKSTRELLRAKLNGCVCWYNCNGTLNCYLSKVLH